MVEAAPATGMDGETGEVLVSLSNRVNEAWVSRTGFHSLHGKGMVANIVRELAKGKDFLFADRGETSLRGFEDPARLYKLRRREED